MRGERLDWQVLIETAPDCARPHGRYLQPVISAHLPQSAAFAYAGHQGADRHYEDLERPRPLGAEREQGIPDRPPDHHHEEE
jgi:hypothetical protein